MRDDEIPEALWRAYEETVFEVDAHESGAGFAIRIGHRSRPLDELLAQHGCQDWAFITAWNPRSVPQPPALNEASNRALEQALEAGAHPVFGGRGIGRDAAWEPEASFLVLGISQDEALRLGRRFGQHAIVAGRLGEAAALLACGRSRVATDRTD